MRTGPWLCGFDSAVGCFVLKVQLEQTKEFYFGDDLLIKKPHQPSKFLMFSVRVFDPEDKGKEDTVPALKDLLLPGVGMGVVRHGKNKWGEGLKKYKLVVDRRSWRWGAQHKECS